MQYNKFPVVLRRSGHVSAIAKVIYCYMLDLQGLKGRCWPSLLQIAKENATSKNTVRRALAELEKAGLIRAERTGGHLGDGSNAYEVFEIRDDDDIQTGLPGQKWTTSEPITECLGGPELTREVVRNGPPSARIDPLSGQKWTSIQTKSDLNTQTKSDLPEGGCAASGSKQDPVPHAPPPPPPPPMQSEGPSPYHPLHQALLDTFHLKNVSEYDHKRLADIAVQLEAKGAQPADIPERLAAFRIKWPRTYPQPHALLVNWDRLADGPMRLAVG